MAINVKLDDVLYARRMSLTELSERVGITLANLSVLKTGKARAIRFSTLDAICEALECQPGDILEFRANDERGRNPNDTGREPNAASDVPESESEARRRAVPRDHHRRRRAQGFISARLVVTGDAAATARTFVASSTLIRVAFAIFMVEMACQTWMTAVMFDLLMPVDRSLARTMACSATSAPASRRWRASSSMLRSSC